MSPPWLPRRLPGHAGLLSRGGVSGSPMARRRAAVSASGGDPVLPRHLLKPRGLSAGQYRDFLTEKREWLLAHGINPGDWTQVREVLRRSREAHGLESPAERARRKLVLTDDH